MVIVMMGMIQGGLIPAGLAMKDQKKHAEGIKGGHKYAEQKHAVHHRRGDQVRGSNGFNDHVFGIKARQKRGSDQGQRPNE